MRAFPQAARNYLIGLWLLALLFFFGSLFLYSRYDFALIPITSPLLFQLLSALIFAVGLTIADLTAFHMDNGRVVSIAVALLITGMTALSWPMLLVAIALGSFSASLARETPWWQTASVISVRWLAFMLATAITTLIWMLDPFLNLAEQLPYTTLISLIGLLISGSIVYGVERAAETALLALNEGKSFRDSWRGRREELLWHMLILAPLGGLLATLWEISGWAFMLGIVPIVVVYRTLHNQSELHHRSTEVQNLAASASEVNSKLERLQNLAITLIATRDVPTMLKTLCDRLASLLGASSGWVTLLDDDQQPRMVAWHNLPIQPQGHGPFIAPWPQSYEPVLKRQRVVVVTDQRVQTLAPLSALSDERYWNALIAIPLIAEQRALGMICLAFVELRGLREDEQRILAAFARQTAMVLENARLFREVQEKQAEIVQSSKLAALGTFSAGIGHEFNNLLAGMLGYAQLGLASDDTDTKNESLKVVVDTCKRGKSITGSLLTFARRQKPRRELSDLREHIEGTLMLMEIELRKFNISVERHIKPVPLTICDPGQISQVFLNLLTNARDAMKADGGRLTVTLEGDDETISFKVRDTGCGIPDEIRDKIFEPFVTTKGALGGSQTSGTGLGLSVSYGIVQSHGGAIDIDSAPGQGATMTVHLPVITEEAPAKTPDAERDNGQMPALRILVVDDDPNIGTALKSLLERSGHQVAIANDGTSALNAYRSATFELVISDMAMPGMSGVGVVRALRALDPNATVLICTGQAPDQQIKQALEAGAVGVLRKPFELDDILKALHEAWKQRQREIMA